MRTRSRGPHSFAAGRLATGVRMALAAIAMSASGAVVAQQAQAQEQPPADTE
jgi:hypothetical protein